MNIDTNADKQFNKILNYELFFGEAIQLLYNMFEVFAQHDTTVLCARIIVFFVILYVSHVMMASKEPLWTDINWMQCKSAEKLENSTHRHTHTWRNQCRHRWNKKKTSQKLQRPQYCTDHRNWAIYLVVFSVTSGKTENYWQKSPAFLANRTEK